MIVKSTNRGEILCPDTWDEIDNFWADVLYDRCRVDELRAIIAAIRKESYERGYFDGYIDVLPEAGSISPEPASEEAGGSGESGQGEAPSGVSGSVPACYWRERADEA
jgi:hypothetical protein